MCIGIAWKEYFKSAGKKKCVNLSRIAITWNFLGNFGVSHSWNRVNMGKWLEIIQKSQADVVRQYIEKPEWLLSILWDTEISSNYINSIKIHNAISYFTHSINKIWRWVSPSVDEDMKNYKPS